MNKMTQRKQNLGTRAEHYEKTVYRYEIANLQQKCCSIFFYTGVKIVIALAVVHVHTNKLFVLLLKRQHG